MHAENTEMTPEQEEELLAGDDDALEAYCTDDEAGAEPENKKPDNSESDGDEAGKSGSEAKPGEETKTGEGQEGDEGSEKSEKDEEPAGYEKWSENEKGLYHAKKQEKVRRQEAEKVAQEAKIEAERLKAANEATLKVMKEMRQSGGQRQEQQPQSEYDKVMQEIKAKADQYKAEYGEDYRLTLDEIRLLDDARKTDSENFAKQERTQTESRNAKEALDSFVQHSDKSEDDFKAKLAAEGGDDYDHVWKSFIEPMIREEIATQKFSPTLYKITNSKNPAETAYGMMTNHPEGQKYYEQKITDKAKKSLAKEVITETDKKPPTTSAGAEGGAGSDGKTKITPQMLNADYDKWHDKLDDDQLEALCEGKDVYI